MDGISRQEASWLLEKSTGLLRNSNSLDASVDVARPSLGLRDVHLNKQPVDAKLLCIERGDAECAADDWPLPLGETYVRGADLVAGFQPTNDWPYSPQIYWRANKMAAGRSINSISILISVQTQLLDTWPEIVIQSQLTTDESFYVDGGTTSATKAKRLTGSEVLYPSGSACGVVSRLKDLPISYAEFMLPSDFRECAFSHINGQIRARWKVFAEFLEKGVIRRARLTAIFFERDGDLSAAAEFCREVGHSAPPLTT